jgi:hypothetical protein
MLVYRFSAFTLGILAVLHGEIFLKKTRRGSSLDILKVKQLRHGRREGSTITSLPTLPQSAEMVMTTFALGKLLLFLHAELSSLRPRHTLSAIFCNKKTLTRNHVMPRGKGFFLDKSGNVMNVPSDRCRLCLSFQYHFHKFYLLCRYCSNTVVSRKNNMVSLVWHCINYYNYYAVCQE